MSLLPLISKLLTIIVPTYNMEDYLDKCLTSLIVGEADNELMQSLEVLVVNDGSTDRSSEIAHGYEARYPDTFKVIDKENGNYGSCINAALPVATGKYVKVLDADDWFETEAFRDFLLWLKDKEADAVITNCNIVKHGNTQLFHDYAVEPYQILSFKDNYTQLYNLLMHEVTYKLSIFKGLGYHQTEGIYYTDKEWTYLPLSTIKTFIYYPKVIYCYLLGRSGQTMDPIVSRKNLCMRIKGMFHFIDIYESCRSDRGKRNYINVNMIFLRTMCISHVTSSYVKMLARQDESELVDLYKKTEQRIHSEYPDFYEEMNSFVFPSETFKPPHLSFHPIRSWRRYGKTITTLHLWFINRCNGFLYRIYRILKKRK